MAVPIIPPTYLGATLPRHNPLSTLERLTSRPSNLEGLNYPDPSTDEAIRATLGLAIKHLATFVSGFLAGTGFTLVLVHTAHCTYACLQSNGNGDGYLAPLKVQEKSNI